MVGFQVVLGEHCSLPTKFSLVNWTLEAVLVKHQELGTHDLPEQSCSFAVNTGKSDTCLSIPGDLGSSTAEGCLCIVDVTNQYENRPQIT